MAKHLFTLNIRMEGENAGDKPTESNLPLVLSPEMLYGVVTYLRNDMLADLDELSSEEFKGAVERASEINAIAAHIEQYAVLENASDEDDED